MNVATEEHNIKEDDTLIVRDRHGPLATLRPFQRWKLSEVGLSGKVTPSNLIFSLQSEDSSLCFSFYHRFPFKLSLISLQWLRSYRQHGYSITGMLTI